MSEKNSTRGGPAAGKFRESDGLDKLLWSDSTEEEYLKQMVGEEQAETSTLPGAIKAMDGICVDENASLDNRNISSLERIVRLVKKKELQESDNKSNSCRDESYHDDGYNTVDEMIEEFEREEETNLNNILERIPTNSNSVPTEHLAEKPSMKNIRMNIRKTVQDREASLPNNSKKKSLTTTMNNSFSAGSRQDGNNSLLGDETVDKIVTHMMNGDNSTDEGEERTLRSWTDFQPIAGSVATPTGKNSSDNKNDSNGNAADIDAKNKFVNDETSVGSISDEIEVIVAKHKRQLDDEVDATKNMVAGEVGTLPNTMVSSITFEETHHARNISSMEKMPSTIGNYESMPSTPTVSEYGDDVEKGENEQWWVKAEKLPTTPKRFSIGTPSPQGSVEHPKKVPGTPSTVIITGHPLGLATPTSSMMDPYEYEDNQYAIKSDDAYMNVKSFAGWGRLAFLKRESAKYGKFYFGVMVGAMFLLVFSIILIIVAFAKVGKSARESNEASPLLPPLSPLTAPEEDNIFNLQTTSMVDKPPTSELSPIEDIITVDKPPTSQISPTEDIITVDKPPTSQTSPSFDGLAIGESAFEDIEDFAFFYERLIQALSERLPESLQALDDPTTPQFRALQWLKSNPPSIEDLKSRPLVQKYVLAVLYFTTNGEEWYDNTGWMSSNDECEWFSTSSGGSICDSIGRVQEIDMRSNNLKGSLPSELGLLSKNLVRIRVNGNLLSGTFPSEIGELTNLERFHVHWNLYSGALPTNLSNLASSLKSLRLGHNDFVGSIPWQMLNLQNLDALDLGNNQLTGTIPPYLETLSSLVELNLSNNFFSGTIPLEFMNLKSLINLELHQNNLTGSMPTQVCSRLPYLEVAKVDCKEVACWCCEGCH